MTEDEVDYFRNVAEDSPTYCVYQICRRLQHSDQSRVPVVSWPYNHSVLIQIGMECIANGHPEVIVHCNQKQSSYNGYMGHVLVEDLAKEMIKAIKNRNIFCIFSQKIRTDQLYVDKEMNLLELQRFFKYNKTSLAFVLDKGK